jgi:hypothetical protein
MTYCTQSCGSKQYAAARACDVSQSAPQKIKVTMIYVLTPTPNPIHPYSGQQGWTTLPQLAYQILLNVMLCRSNLI